MYIIFSLLLISPPHFVICANRVLCSIFQCDPNQKTLNSNTESFDKDVRNEGVCFSLEYIYIINYTHCHKSVYYQLNAIIFQSSELILGGAKFRMCGCVCVCMYVSVCAQIYNKYMNICMPSVYILPSIVFKTKLHSLLPLPSCLYSSLFYIHCEMSLVIYASARHVNLLRLVDSHTHTQKKNQQIQIDHVVLFSHIIWF